MVFTVEPFDSRKHHRASFCCGKESLDRYIRQQASQDLKRKIAAIFVLIESSKPNILGYYTLSSYTVELAELDDSLAKRLPRYPLLPATLLGRLAVDQNAQGQKMGEFILIDALRRSLKTTEQVASLAVIAEALDEEAIRFYQKYGFQTFKQHPMKLYLPMKLIQKLWKISDT